MSVLAVVVASSVLSIPVPEPGAVPALLAPEPIAFTPHGPPAPPPPPGARARAAAAAQSGGSGAGGRTGGLPRGGGVTGRPNGGLTGGGAGIPSAVTRRASVTNSDPGWLEWWALSRDRYLRLPAHLDATVQTLADPDAPSLNVDEALRRRAMPALLEGLRHENTEFAAACLMTLARALPEAERPAVLAHIHKILPKTADWMQGTAVLAMGVLGDERARPMLLEIVRDERSGRARLRCNEEIPCFLRSFAALALGLLGDPSAADELLLQWNSADCDQMRSCLLLGASSCAPEHPLLARTAQRVLMDRRASALLRAQAATALSRMQPALARSALATFVQLLEDRDTPRELRQSALLALGRLASPADSEIVDALKHATATASHDVRGAAWIALGRILERDEQPGATRAVRDAVIEFLLRAVRKPEHGGDRPWAALAAGLAVRPEAEGSPARRLVSNKLLETIHDEKTEDVRAALAIAIGLSDHGGAAAELLSELERRPRGRFGKSAAQALAMLGVPATGARLEGLARNDQVAEDVQSEIVRALSAVGRMDAVRELGEQLPRSGSLWVTAHQTESLGFSRRLAALDPLLALLSDRKRPTAARALAAKALGDLAEPGEAWYAAYTEDANWLVDEPVLEFVFPE